MLTRAMILIFSLSTVSYAEYGTRESILIDPNIGRSKFMMSFDGGGIRGVFSLTILNEIETRLSKPLTDYVDLFTGTSTGGIIALGLASGKKANEILSIYKDEGDKVFYRSCWHKIRSVFGLIDEKYQDTKLNPLLQDYYGKNENGDYNTLADLTLADAMVVAADITDTKVKLFSSYAAKEKASENYPLWLSARATSAAPTYFEPVNIDGHAIVDGGIFANNPTLLGVEQIGNMYGDEAIAHLKTVSIGTGSYSPGFTFEQAKDMGVLNWASPISSTMMSLRSKMTHIDMRKQYPKKKSETQYRRLNVKLQKEITLDDASTTNIQELEDIALAYIQAHPKKIDHVVKMFQYNGKK